MKPKNKDRLLAILTYIQGYEAKHDFLPSRADIGRAFGISRQRAYQLFMNLVKQEYLKKDGKNYTINK